MKGSGPVFQLDHMDYACGPVLVTGSIVSPTFSSARWQRGALRRYPSQMAAAVYFGPFGIARMECGLSKWQVGRFECEPLTLWAFDIRGGHAGLRYDVFR